MSEEQKYGIHVTHDFVAFLTEGGKAILKFERDGTVEVGAEFKPDEAGRLAASIFSQNMSGVLSCLRDAALEEAAKVAEKYERNAGVRAGLHKREDAKAAALDKNTRMAPA